PVIEPTHASWSFRRSGFAKTARNALADSASWPRSRSTRGGSHDGLRFCRRRGKILRQLSVWRTRTSAAHTTVRKERVWSDQENASQDEEMQEQEEADVEAHLRASLARTDDAEGEEPDVEAHRRASIQ